MIIKWRSTFSGNFYVINDVRQGGVLSPLLFYVYVDELSGCQNKSSIGGSMNDTIINHMLYANDMCIISLSLACLQHLLNICTGYNQLLKRNYHYIPSYTKDLKNIRDCDISQHMFSHSA